MTSPEDIQRMWLYTAALGRPVVPEVKISSVGASARTSARPARGHGVRGAASISSASIAVARACWASGAGFSSSGSR